MTRRRVLARLLLAAAGLLALGSCVTGPTIVHPPEWSMLPPADSDRRLFFVASGDTRRAAAQDMAYEVVSRFALGSEADSEAAALVELRDRLASAASGELGAEVTGFAVEERAVSRAEGKATHWILAAYDRREFQRVELALARKVPGGNTGPPLLRRGTRRAEEGELLSALRDYGRAVVETAETPYAEETAAFAARLTSDVIERIDLVAERTGVRTRIGRSPEEALSARVRDAAEGAGIPGMPVLITHREAVGGGPTGGDTGGGSPTYETRRLYRHTDEEGRIRFTPPAPRERGTEQVEITLAPFFDLVTPGREPEGLLQLMEVARGHSTILEYRAFSRAPEIATGVLVVDTDIAGNPTGTMATQQGLLSGFEQHGFATDALGFDPHRFLALEDADRGSVIRQRFNRDYERAVLGTASIRGFDEENSVSVEVAGELRVLDLETGEELYRKTMVQRSRGNNASSVIAAAFRSLGAKFAADLARTLP